MREDRPWDVVVLGAGPAGLFCAANLPRAGRVLVVEKNDRPGRKLLLTGGGHCNFTHAGGVDDLVRRYGEHGEFLRPALEAFASRALVAFFRGHGLASKTDASGRVTPRSNRAGDVLDVLVRAARAAGARLQLGQGALDLGRSEAGDLMVRTQHATLRATTVVLACGGKSYPATGSAGDGYAWLEALGHSIIAPRPALAPLLCTDPAVRLLAGLTVRCTSVSLWRDGRRVRSCEGDVLWTHRGFSGPAIQDLSRYVEAGDRIGVRLLPGVEPRSLTDRLTALWSTAGARAVRTLVRDLGLTGRLADAVIASLGIDGWEKVARLSRRVRADLVDRLLAFPAVISGRGGFDCAMVTQGGVRLDEVDPVTMESRRVPGLFFAGEVLDVDGDCGGYNLQAAFSTARAAAEAIRKRFKG